MELKEATSESVKKKIQDIQLRRDYEDALNVLERIPQRCWIFTQSQRIEERRSLLKKYYDDPKYNAAFERCADVMARLMLKYGSVVLAKREVKDGRLMELGGDRSELGNCQEASIQPKEKQAV